VWAPCLEGPDTCGDTMDEAGRIRPAYKRSCLREEVRRGERERARCVTRLNCRRRLVAELPL
jgi:hypothetical protein